MKKLYIFCETAIKLLTIVPLLFLFVVTMLYQNTISFDIMELSTIVSNGPKFFLVLFLAFFLLYGLYRLLQKIPETGLFLGLTLVYLLAGAFLFLHMDTVLRYDSGICYWNAENYVKGNYVNFRPGEYFYRWPHQLGLVSYNCILVAISDNLNLVYFTNLVWVILTNLFIWLITRLIYEEKPMLRKWIVVMVFCFLPQFFYAFYAYGQVPGLCFLTGALWCTVFYLRRNRKGILILLFLFMAASCVVAPNFAVGGIAIIIILFLHFLKTQKWQCFLLMMGIVICMIVPNRMVISYYERVAEADLSHGMPSVLYVAMGLQENEEGVWRANGWYNGYSADVYDELNYDEKESGRVGLLSIQKRMKEFLENPAYAADFFGEKLITTWCEPTYQSIWSGPMIVMGSTTDVPIIAELYSGGPVFDHLASAMNVLVVYIFGFVLFYVILKTFIRKEYLNEPELFSILFFIGGFIFHLFWETKSRYVYFYVFMLIPVAGCGICFVFGLIDRMLKNRKKICMGVRGKR